MGKLRQEVDTLPSCLFPQAPLLQFAHPTLRQVRLYSIFNVIRTQRNNFVRYIMSSPQEAWRLSA